MHNEGNVDIRQKYKDSMDRKHAADKSFESLFLKYQKKGDASVMHNGASIIHNGQREQFNSAANAGKHLYTEKRKVKTKTRWDVVQTREILEVGNITFLISRCNSLGRVMLNDVVMCEGSFNKARDYWCDFVSLY